MDQEQLAEISSKISDQKYIKFISDEGWKYETEEELAAGYARLVKAEHGILLTEEEFVAELCMNGDTSVARQLYRILRNHIEKGALSARDLYRYAKYHWCTRHPNAVVAYQIGPKLWAVNTCSEAISEEWAKLLINSEWGFEASRIKLLGTPYYDATDWNFIGFRCGACD